jgi:integrase
LSTNLKTLGVDDTVIQLVLRHADVTVTQRSYIKVEDKIKSAAMEKLQKALSAKLKSRKRDREKGS